MEAEFTDSQGFEYSLDRPDFIDLTDFRNLSNLTAYTLDAFDEVLDKLKCAVVIVYKGLPR